MSRAPHPFPPDSESRFPWEKACYALLAGIGLVLLAAWKNDFFEVMSGLMMGVFFLWQVVRGLIIKRYFWHIAEEKVSFWSLLVALLLALLFYWICCKGTKHTELPNSTCILPFLCLTITDKMIRPVWKTFIKL